MQWTYIIVGLFIVGIIPTELVRIIEKKLEENYWERIKEITTNKFDELVKDEESWDEDVVDVSNFTISDAEKEIILTAIKNSKLPSFTPYDDIIHKSFKHKESWTYFWDSISGFGIGFSKSINCGNILKKGALVSEVWEGEIAYAISLFNEDTHILDSLKSIYKKTKGPGISMYESRNRKVVLFWLKNLSNTTDLKNAINHIIDYINQVKESLS